MSLNQNSDLAAVSVDKKIHLFYQPNDGQHIKEVSSEDGKKWSDVSTLADGEVTSAYSQLTAFYCKNDATNGGKPSIHVIYIDSKVKLRERIRAVEDTSTWKELQFPEGLAKPVPTSKLASGICHDKPNTSVHHWVYFSDENEKGEQHIQELRKTNNDEWVLRKPWDQDYGTSLSGTTLAASLTDPTNHMLFQTSNLDIWRAKGAYEKWEEVKMIRKGEETIANTPLASCIDSKGKYYVFFVKKIGSMFKFQSFVDGKQSDIADTAIWTPGSYIGAVVHNDKPHLFVDRAHNALHISTYTYDGSTWTLV